MLIEKRCSRCREIKPASEFHRSSTRKTGLYPSCKVCRCDGVPRLNVHERFQANVRKTITPPGCWLWEGGQTRCPMRYGMFYSGSNGKGRRAHRVAYEMYVKEIPDGMCVLHHCDTALCVRPDHLFLGTRVDNNADRDRKGRHGTKGKKKVRCGYR